MLLRDRVRDTIRRHRMLEGGETVLVGVSGGADSVALLHVLHALSAELRLSLAVVHLDHGLRPDSATDADFVEALARDYGVPSVVERIVIAPGSSLEAQARAARYAALGRHAERVGAGRVALGHTADDQAETVLMRVLEGAGPRGLAGIPPRRGIFIRPLIEIRRTEIVEELRRAGRGWRDDPSNRDPKFLRNRIRHELLPLLAASYNPAVVPALTRIADLIRPLLDQLEDVASRELGALLARTRDDVTAPVPGPANDIVVSRTRLRELPTEVAAEVLRVAAVRLGRAAPLRAWAQRGVRRILRDPPPRRPFRLHGLAIDVSGDRVRLAIRPRPRLAEPRALSIPGLTRFPELGRAIQAQVLSRPLDYTPPPGSHRVAFDADLLTAPLSVRGRRPGDRFVPFGSPDGCRLKSFLIGARIPRWERDALALVECGREIIWIPAVRRAACAPVSETTRRVLELAWMPLPV